VRLASPRVVRSAAALVIVLTVIAPRAASAHTALDYTLPTDGATIGEPVGEVTVAFTEAVTLVGNGFEVRDPQGNIVEPFAVTDDDTVFRLQLDPPLAGGAVGVRYEVTSDDGHVVSGAFSFTVAAPAPTVAPVTTPATSADTTPATTSPGESTTTAPGASATSATSTATQPPTQSSTQSSATAPSLSAPSDIDPGFAGGDGGDSNAGAIIAIAVAVALAAVAFLLVRSRTSGGR
jgi:methionine-rich copper-binding protein CopC